MLFANIMMGEGNAVGRGGLGAVLGAKRVKALTVDGVMASVGSYNFSSNSDTNMESTIVTHDPDLVRDVETMLEADRLTSTRVH